MGDVLLVGSCAGYFLALNRHDGKEIWRYDTRQDGSPATFHGDPLVIDNTAITGCDSSLSYTYAFDITSGKQIWRRGGSSLNSDIIQAAGCAVGRRWNGDLLGISITNGERVWCRQPLDYTYPLNAFYSPAARGDTVIFGGVDGVLYAVDGHTGDIVWTYDSGNAFTTTAAVDGNDVYVGLTNHSILRLSSRDGKFLGSTRLDKLPFGDPVVASAVVMVMTDPGTLVALSRDLSTEVWKKESAPSWTTPRPLVWRDLVLVGRRDGKVYGFRTDNGETALELTLKGTIRGLGAHADVLYIGTLNGDLFACRPKLK